MYFSNLCTSIVLHSFVSSDAAAGTVKVTSRFRTLTTSHSSGTVRWTAPRAHTARAPTTRATLAPLCRSRAPAASTPQSAITNVTKLLISDHHRTCPQNLCAGSTINRWFGRATSRPPRSQTQNARYPPASPIPTYGDILSIQDIELWNSQNVDLFLLFFFYRAAVRWSWTGQRITLGLWSALHSSELESWYAYKYSLNIIYRWNKNRGWLCPDFNLQMQFNTKICFSYLVNFLQIVVCFLFN